MHRAETSYWKALRKWNPEGRRSFMLTHYLWRAEQLCDRMVIMDSGRNIAQGTVIELQNPISTQERVEVGFITDDTDIENQLEELPHVVKVTRKKTTTSSILKNRRTIAQSHQIHRVQRVDLYRTLQVKDRHWSDIFLELTGKELRDWWTSSAWQSI